jgi:hypothetical protein
MGVVEAIVLGGGMALLAVFGVLWWKLRRRRQRQQLALFYPPEAVQELNEALAFDRIVTELLRSDPHFADTADRVARRED